MKYKKGDVVVVKFPFIIEEKSKEQKGRPALVISDERVTGRYRDVVLAAITSQIPPNIMELETESAMDYFGDVKKQGDPRHFLKSRNQQRRTYNDYKYFYEKNRRY